MPLFESGAAHYGVQILHLNMAIQLGWAQICQQIVVFNLVQLLAWAWLYKYLISLSYLWSNPYIVTENVED